MPLGPGSRLDAYEIVAPLGKGGMGEVWLARDRKLNRQVALKVLPPDLTQDPSRVARFQQEARAASALNHPNVGTIHSLGETADGQQFIAMEFVEGETLRQRLAGRSVTLREALDLAVQVASALSAAHAAGVVHRDVKPENVMLRHDGIVKVLDFGLAKLAPLGSERPDAHTTHAVVRTDAGTVVGTVDYMSPEQTRGQPVDARTDVWSLGVLLYELVAGRRPFAGQSSSEVLAGILEHEPAPLARFEPDAPHELQRIVAKALRKDREQRYQGMKDLLLDLQALRDEVAGAPPASNAVHVTASLARRKVAAALIVCILALIAAGWWWVARHRPISEAVVQSPTPVQRTLTRLTFGSGLQTDVTWSPDGTRIAYAADRNGNFDIWSQPTDGGDPVQVTTSPAADTQPSWSPDGRNIAFRSERNGGGLFVVPALGGPERQLSSFGVYPQWSPDGAGIMFHAYAPFPSNVYRVSPEGGELPREILKDFVHGGFWAWIAFHPDGRMSLLGIHRQRGPGFFTVSQEDGHVTTSNIAPGLPLRFAVRGTRVERFRWNATGDALFAEATVNEVRNVWKIKVEPRTLSWLAAERLTTGMGADAAAALSSDGTHLVFTTEERSERLWAFPFDAVAGRVTGEGRPVSPEEGNVRPSDLSPDGLTVAYGLRRTGSDRSDLWLTHIDSGESELFARNADIPRWSPDGKMIAYNLIRSDRPPTEEWALAVRELGGAERVLSRWSTQSALMPQDWTRDGRAILAVYLSPIYSGVARLDLWPIENAAATAPHRVLVKDARARIWEGRYSPDGRWLSFIAEPIDERARFLQLAVVPAAGGSAAEWTHIAREHEWPDKPRWAPDGRTIYFLSRHNSSVFNLWGSRFDRTRGKPVGEPFMITHFDAPSRVISTEFSRSSISISARRALLTMTTASGNIWMLDNVDR